MQTNPAPEIDQSDLKAARDFLSSLGDEGRPARPVQKSPETRGAVTVRNGITRARMRSAKTSA